ncbi:MAG: DUF5690 family protein [Agriterribacter sp.]
MQKLYRNPAWALVAGFGTYFCMYGFRKPYTAATYDDNTFLGIDYKFLLIIFQTAGYVIAKWLGIKIIAEIRREQRIKLLLSLILFAELMLLLFAFIPFPLNIVCLFLNGLALGVVFGLVLGCMEGRKNTEALVAGLCASFILADGVSKSVGQFLLNNTVPEKWMPFVAGIIFLVPTFLFVAMLSKVPAPSKEDITNRSERIPMKGMMRKNFFIKYWPGLTCVTLAYLFVTLLRSLRADFAPELWRNLGYHQTPALYTQSELVVSFGVVIINGLAVFIKDHRKAFCVSLVTCIAGFMTLLLSIAGFEYGMNVFVFMVLAGLGVYIPYVAIHTTVFERLIAVTKEKATTGFLMYVVDSVGYTGYILLMLFRYFTPPGQSVLSLFTAICINLGIAGAAIILLSIIYFTKKRKHNEPGIGQFSTGKSGYL